MIEVKTFTPVYDEAEDRIRLIANYKDVDERIDYMITRSMIIKLVPQMHELIQEYDVKNTIPLNNKADSINRGIAGAKQDGEKKIPKKSNQTETLIKQDGILLLSVNFTVTSDKKGAKIVFSGQNNIQAQTLMSWAYIDKLAKALDAALPKLQWGITRLI